MLETIQKKLEEAEENYRFLIENVNSIVLRMDPVGKITFMNQFALEFFGYSKDIIGRNVVGTIVPEIESTGRNLGFLIRDIAVNPDHYINNVNENMKSNGERVWVSWSNKLVLDKNDQPAEVLCIGNNITEHKETLKELEIAKNTLQSIIDNIPVRVFWKDRQSRFLGCNQLIANDAGVTNPNELIGKTDFDFPWKEQAESYQQKDREVMSSGKPVLNIVEPQTRPDGKIIWLNTSKAPLFGPKGEIIGILGIYEDITEHRKNEKALRENEERLRLAMTTAKQGWFELNIQTGEVIASPEYINIIGFDPEHFSTNFQEWTQGIHPDDRSSVLELFQKAISSGRVITGEYRRMTAQRNWKWIRSTGKVLYDSDGKAQRMIGIHADISELKASEESLCQSESKFSTVFRLNPSPMIITHLEQGEIIDANESFLEGSGFNLKDILGRSAVEAGFISQKIRETLLNGIALNGRVKDLEIQVKVKSGKLKDCNLSSELIKINGEDCILTVIEDITEKKEAERAVQENLHFLQTILDAIPYPVFFKDTLGFYLGCNTAYETFFGIKKETMVGKRACDIFPPHLAEIYNSMDALLFHDQQIQSYESRARFADGIEHDVIFNKAPYWDREGVLAGLVGVVVDVSERKRFEEEIKQSKARLEQLFDFLPDATFAIDRKGKVIAWNKEIELMTGILKQEMLGKNNHEYAIPFYGMRRPILIDLVLKKQGEFERRYEEISRTSNLLTAETFISSAYQGRGAYISGRASPLFDSDGNIIGSIESIRDISERKHAEKMLMQQEKLKALGLMASGIVHDINNLLAPILGYTELMMVISQKRGEDETYARYLSNIQRSTHDITGIISGLREFYQLHDTNLMPLPPVQVNHIIPQAIELTKPKWKAESEKVGIRIELVSDLSPNLPLINASETQIREILINLIINSIDSMPQGGMITLKTELADEIIQLSVSDTGTGMDNETLSRCLDPYFTTKGSLGTGMGLPMVFGIMQKHKGKIDISSWPGKGTIVKLFFPVCQSINRSINTKEEKENIPLRILLIDDDEYVRDVIPEMLAYDKHEVMKACSGSEGLAKFESNQFDLVITDLGMPGMNGWEVVENIRKISDVPIIISTGFGCYLDSEELLRIKSFGKCFVLSKPAKLEELQEAISKIMEL